MVEASGPASMRPKVHKSPCGFRPIVDQTVHMAAIWMECLGPSSCRWRVVILSELCTHGSNVRRIPGHSRQMCLLRYSPKETSASGFSARTASTSQNLSPTLTDYLTLICTLCHGLYLTDSISRTHGGGCRRSSSGWVRRRERSSIRHRRRRRKKRSKRLQQSSKLSMESRQINEVRACNWARKAWLSGTC